MKYAEPRNYKADMMTSAIKVTITIIIASHFFALSSRQSTLGHHDDVVDADFRVLPRFDHVNHSFQHLVMTGFLKQYIRLQAEGMRNIYVCLTTFL